MAEPDAGPSTRLRHSAAHWCFFKRTGLDPTTCFQRLRSLGVGGVEMAPPEHWDAAKRVGLERVNVGAPGMTSGLNDRRHHASLIPQIAKLIDTAAREDIGHIIVFSGSERGQDPAEALDACAEALIELARRAEEDGVDLLLEVLNRQDHPDYLADRSSFGIELVRRVGSPRLKLLLDAYPLARSGEDPVAVMTEHLDLIGHIHVADAPDRGLPSADRGIDFPTLVSRIHQAGYRGWWGHEFIPASDAIDELNRSVQRLESWA